MPPPSSLLPLFRRLMLFGVVAASEGAVGARAPNVLLIISDDQAWYDYSFMRRPDVEPAINENAGAENDARTGMRIRNVVRTPAIDRLADGGLTFFRGYSPVSLCRPALASIVTGLYPYQHRITGNNPPPGEDARYDRTIVSLPTLPRLLSEHRGVVSFQTGKWWEGAFSNGGFSLGDTVDSTDPALRPRQWRGVLPPYAPARHGDWGLMIGRVDYVEGRADTPKPLPYPIKYSNTLVPVTDFIDAQAAANRPFFVWYAPMLPHTPHFAPAEMEAYYVGLGIDARTAKYYANCELWDGTVGALMEHLARRGLVENTLVVYTTDNGWVQDPGRGQGDSYLGSANNAATSKSKRSGFDGGLRTPIIVHWPAGLAARRLAPQFVSTPVSNIDLAATILAAFGLGPPPGSFGVNLLDLDRVRSRREIFGDVYQHDATAATLEDPRETLRYSWVVRDGWKFIRRHADPGGDSLFHLYDYDRDSRGVAVDPFETSDLVSKMPARADELRRSVEAGYGSSPNGLLRPGRSPL
jgi:arylsulfatase A-like enzyme